MRRSGYAKDERGFILYAPRNAYAPRAPSRPSGRVQLRDWIVSPSVSLGNADASVEAYTEYRGASFREQFSLSPFYAGVLQKGRSGTEYRITYAFITPAGHMENGMGSAYTILSTRGSASRRPAWPDTNMRRGTSSPISSRRTCRLFTTAA